RGMWHSIPAALIFAGLAFLITGSEDVNVKYFKALAVFLGTMSHLVLDEVYSVDTRGVVPKFKKSFGTAVKFWGKNPWANFSTYAKLAVVAVLVFGDIDNLGVYDRFKEHYPRVAGELEGVGDRMQSLGQDIAQQVQTRQPQQSPVYQQPPQYQPPQPSAPAWGPPPGWQPSAPTAAQPNYAPQQGGFLPNNGARPATPWGGPAFANPR
ncbi:MAG: metal-dependent hydrolase, partial [Planctomycetales bacterium]|nr:metal-dependent hydrolase [Planctomycetales bacterium]